MEAKDRKLPTGVRRAQIAKRAQLVLGLIAGSAMLYRMVSVWFQ